MDALMCIAMRSDFMTIGMQPLDYRRRSPSNVAENETCRLDLMLATNINQPIHERLQMGWLTVIAGHIDAFVVDVIPLLNIKSQEVPAR